MKIGFGCDHVALDLKNEIMEYIIEKGHTVKDYGSYTTERSDYPVYGYKVAKAVVSGECDAGIIVCGTGVGISIAANKVAGIRCVVCSEPYSARLSKEHNNTNMLAFGARVVGSELAKMIVDNWLAAEHLGGRHSERISMLTEIESNAFQVLD